MDPDTFVGSMKLQAGSRTDSVTGWCSAYSENPGGEYPVAEVELGLCSKTVSGV